MNVTLRDFNEPDIQRLEEWVRNIDSRRYMSHHRPSAHEVTANDPGLGVFWFVIQESGADIGTIWLEAAEQPGELVLGILLGDEAHFGRGIGSKAIALAVEKARAAHQYQTIRLNVRSNNTRAIACYYKAGFKLVKTDIKVTTSELIPYVTMFRLLE